MSGSEADDDPDKVHQPPRNEPSRSIINKITWAQVGRVAEPGRYMFKFGWLTITAEDLAVWKLYPNAAFTLFTRTTAADGKDEFRLGTFELRETLSLSEK